MEGDLRLQSVFVSLLFLLLFVFLLLVHNPTCTADDTSRMVAPAFKVKGLWSTKRKWKTRKSGETALDSLSSFLLLHLLLDTQTCTADDTSRMVAPAFKVKGLWSTSSRTQTHGKRSTETQRKRQRQPDNDREGENWLLPRELPRIETPSPLMRKTNLLFWFWVLVGQQWWRHQEHAVPLVLDELLRSTHEPKEPEATIKSKQKRSKATTKRRGREKSARSSRTQSRERKLVTKKLEDETGAERQADEESREEAPKKNSRNEQAMRRRVWISRKRG